MDPTSTATMEARLARTLETRLAPVLRDTELLAHAVALSVPWLLADPERLRLDRANRLRLDPGTSVVLQRLARTLSWMAEPRYHHGQQASGLASKALRAIKAERVDMEGALSLAARFRTVRYGHVRRNARDRAYAPQETISLPDSDTVASRMVRDDDLRKVGLLAGNCLAWADHRKRYTAGMKDGTTAMWRIDQAGEDGRQVPIWTLAISIETNALMEFEHTGDVLTVPRDRDSLLAFLSGQDLDCSGLNIEAALAQFAISPALVTAAASGQVRESVERLDGKRWRFQIGAPGVLVAIPLHRPVVFGNERISSWMLQGPGMGARSVLSIQRPGATDEEDDEFFYGADRGGERYMLDLMVRLALRQACATKPALRAACMAAFGAENPLFIEDWFGQEYQPISDPARHPP